MFRPDRATLRSAGFVVLLTGVFLLVNSQVVYAASSNSETGDLLAPLNITSSEGVPINGYELNADGGSLIAFKTQALAFALSGLFTLIRLLVGLAGWAIELAFRFPLLKILTRPAQKVADTYDNVVVDTLGLKGLLLAWAFVFAGFMIVRGRVGRGLGEIFLTLLIGAIAASALIRPDTLLAQDGPLGQSQQVAAEVAQQSVNSYDWGGKLASRGPCAGMAGMQEVKCLESEGDKPVSAEEVARPIQDSITNALIVKPYMLLQYGRILDPAKTADRKAYAVHLKWITGGYKADGKDSEGEKNNCSLLDGQARKVCESDTDDEEKDPCELIRGEAKKYCERNDGDTPSSDDLPSLTPGGELLDASNAIVTDEDREFYAFMQDMKKAGDVGKACADYAQKPTWWRVGGAALLLIAALFICGMLLSSAIVLLGTQGICVAAAAAGGVTFIAGMLPGPARQSVWKWLSIWGISVLTVVGICAFIPFFGIAVDATITDGPDLMVERILLIDVLAVAGAAGHRRLLTGIASFGRRMAMRMRYAKVGGTHMPGDTSELGAALAMNSPVGLGGYGGACALSRVAGRPVRAARHPAAPDGRAGIAGRRRGHACGHRTGAGRCRRRSRARARPAHRGGRRGRGGCSARCEGRPLAADRPPAGQGAAGQVAQAHRRRRPRRGRAVGRRGWWSRRYRAAAALRPARPVPQRAGAGRRPQHRPGTARPEQRPDAAVDPGAQPAGPFPRIPHPEPRRPGRVRGHGRPAGRRPPGAVRGLALLPGRSPAGAGVGQHRPRGRPGLGRHGTSCVPGHPGEQRRRRPRPVHRPSAADRSHTGRHPPAGTPSTAGGPSGTRPCAAYSADGRSHGNAAPATAPAPERPGAAASARSRQAGSSGGWASTQPGARRGAGPDAGTDAADRARGRTPAPGAGPAAERGR
ncbi:hypothetical protein E4N62_25145 [Streptomyces sp. MNU76]|uniref:hypothetical protein n=1 Tax=Streptomyces sp. MNU76 TaxID=2560026 RepID=UPI001E560CBA|nr:hypothetical protein [Streptomyces sp. MNU76]MCC9708258.1 hypothetical protein [Streptomyces sp. MNU76]